MSLLIVSDAGFKVPWFKSVEKHGWFWLGRIRGKVQFAELGSENWDPISKLHTQASSRPKTLGYKNSLRAIQSIATWHSISRYLKAEKPTLDTN